MLKEANFLDQKLRVDMGLVGLEEVIFMIEKYHSPENTLKSKLNEERFEAYLN